MRRLEVLQWLGLFAGASLWATAHVVGFGISQARCSVGGAQWGIHFDLWETVLTTLAGLLVLGSPHHGVLGRIGLGSTADRLLHGAPFPIAVVPAGFAERMPQIARVGVAFLDSKEGREALRAAGGLNEFVEN